MPPRDVIKILQDQGNIPFDVIKYVIFPFLYENTNRIVKRNKRNFKHCIAQINAYPLQYKNHQVDKGEYIIVSVDQYNDRLVWIREPKSVLQREPIRVAIARMEQNNRDCLTK